MASSSWGSERIVVQVFEDKMGILFRGPCIEQAFLRFGLNLHSFNCSSGVNSSMWRRWICYDELHCIAELRNKC